MMISVFKAKEYLEHLTEIESIEKNQNPRFVRKNRHEIEEVNRSFYESILNWEEIEFENNKIYQIVKKSDINFGSKKHQDWTSIYSMSAIKVTRQTPCYIMYQYGNSFSTRECRIAKKNIVAVID